MIRTGTINNALNMRGLKEIPPPICRNFINSKFLRKAKPYSPLLHLTYASCGRVFSCLSLRSALCAIICLFALTFVACSKDADDSVYSNRMYEFYAESCGLKQTSADSVIQFSYKLGRYVTANPESQRNRYYAPTIDNLDSACTKYGVVQIGNVYIKTEWGGETHINF
jgi:hypothetical protein